MGHPSPRWDPAQYDRYADERGRPFIDLTARIGVVSPRTVVDLGCGPGSLTETLAGRWPDASVVGVDSSADMIAAAESRTMPHRVTFVHADIRDWRPSGPMDVVVANAVLQWVPDHLDLMRDVAGWLTPGGALAVQVPDNFSDPSHTVLRDLRRSPRWRARVGDGADRELAVERPERYLAVLTDAGLVPDVWQTTYLHLLTGPDPVLEWMKGTALRPVLSTLADDPPATTAFLGELSAELAAAYPAQETGTIFPFRRTFVVGRRG